MSEFDSFFNDLHSDIGVFIKYMQEHDDEESRKALLRTDYLRLIYCNSVVIRESVFNAVSGGGAIRSAIYVTSREFVKAAKDVHISAEGFGMILPIEGEHIPIKCGHIQVNKDGSICLRLFHLGSYTTKTVILDETGLLRVGGDV